jgi:hypothetical protein
MSGRAGPAGRLWAAAGPVFRPFTEAPGAFWASFPTGGGPQHETLTLCGPCLGTLESAEKRRARATCRGRKRVVELSRSNRAGGYSSAVVILPILLVRRLG